MLYCLAGLLMDDRPSRLGQLADVAIEISTAEVGRHFAATN